MRCKFPERRKVRFTGTTSHSDRVVRRDFRRAGFVALQEFFRGSEWAVHSAGRRSMIIILPTT